MMPQKVDTRSVLRALQGGAGKAQELQIPILGESIWWSLSNVMVTRQGLYTRLQNAGLDPDYTPKKIRTRSTVLRTLEELSADGFIRRIIEAPDHAIFVKVDERVDRLTESADYEAAVKFKYDKKAGTLTASDPTHQPVIDQLMETYANAFLATDIRSVITDLVYSKEINAIPLRGEGGFYFVPGQNQEWVDKLEVFITSLSTSCYLGRLAIPETQATKDTVAKSYMDDFKNEIASAKLEIQKLKDAGTYRDSTLEKKLEKLLEAQANAQIYLQMLNIDKKDIESEVAALERDIMSLFKGSK